MLNIMIDTVYMLGALVMGCIQVCCAALYLRATRYRRIVLIGSGLEYLWAALSYWMTHLHLPRVPQQYLVLFVAYACAFAAAGVVLAIQQRHASQPQVPAHVVWASGVFGAGYALYALLWLLTPLSAA